MHFDPTLRDEVVARVDRLKLPSYTGFVQPRLEAVTTTPTATITDVTISYPHGPDDADAGVLGPEEVATVGHKSCAPRMTRTTQTIRATDHTDNTDRFLGRATTS